jgi:hypothetical protein
MKSTLAHRPPSSRALAEFHFRACLGRDPFSETWEADADGRSWLVKLLFGVPGRLVEDGKRRLQNLSQAALPETRLLAGGPGTVAVVQARPAATLRDHLAECRGRGEAGVAAGPLLNWLRRTAAVLDELGSAGLPHLGLQPRLIGLEGDEIVLLEHGLAVLFWQPAGRLPGPLLGRYAAPELAQGKLTPAGDVYSLAVVFQEALTGTPPFAGARRGDPDLEPLPQALRPIVGQALDVDPERRFASCAAFVTILSAAVQPAVAPITPQPAASTSSAPEEPTVDDSCVDLAMSPLDSQSDDADAEEENWPGEEQPVSGAADAAPPPLSAAPTVPEEGAFELAPVHGPAAEEAAEDSSWQLESTPPAPLTDLMAATWDNVSENEAPVAPSAALRGDGGVVEVPSGPPHDLTFADAVAAEAPSTFPVCFGRTPETGQHNRGLDEPVSGAEPLAVEPDAGFEGPTPELPAAGSIGNWSTFGEAQPAGATFEPVNLAEQFAPDGCSLSGGADDSSDETSAVPEDPDAPAPDREALARALVHEVAASLFEQPRPPEPAPPPPEEKPRSRVVRRPQRPQTEPIAVADPTSPWAAEAAEPPAPVPAPAPAEQRPGLFQPGPALRALLEEARRAMPPDEAEQWLAAPGGGEMLRCTFPASLPPGAPHGVFEGFRLQWGACVVKAEDSAVVFHVGPQAKFWQRWLGRSQGVQVTLHWQRGPETPLPTVTATIRAAGKPGASVLREIGPLLLDSLRVLMQGPPNRRSERRLVWPHPVVARFHLAGGQCSGEVSGHGKDLTSLGLGMYLPRILPGAEVHVILATPTLTTPVRVAGRFIRVQRTVNKDWTEAAVLFHREL